MCCLNFRRMPNHRISNLWGFFLLSKFVVILKYLHVIHQVVKCFFFSFSLWLIEILWEYTNFEARVYPFHQVGSYYFFGPVSAVFRHTSIFYLVIWITFSISTTLKTNTDHPVYPLNFWAKLVSIKCFRVYSGFNQIIKIQFHTILIEKSKFFNNKE